MDDGVKIALARIAKEAAEKTGRLDLSGLGLAELPNEIFALTHLTHLDLGYDFRPDSKRNTITTLDKRFSNFTVLETLDCSYTQIKDLGPLKTLTNLQSLDCSGTQVSHLNPIKNLTNLQSLDCSGTQVSHLNPIKNLTNLQSLYFGRTQVSHLNPIKNLTNLEDLDCSYTQIKDLGPLKDLTNLQSLDCRSTQVTDLGPLKTLTKLQYLNCSDTQVTDLGPLKTLLNTELTRLRVSSPHIQDIPPEILIGDCASALKSHFDDLGDHPIPLGQFKLLILGNGRVGKTQMARALQGLAMVKEDKSTHGIDICTFQIFEDDALPKARIWDFGGQEIYHGTHALFMKGRAVHILAWNEISEREPFHIHDGIEYKNEKLPYWVEFIRRLSGHNNPIIITQTHCDEIGSGEAIPPADHEALNKFPFWKHVNFGAESTEGLSILIEYIKQAQSKIPQPLIGPGRLSVKNAIEMIRRENPTKKFMPFTDFETLCEKTGGISNPKLFAQYLHHADVFFYRQGFFNNNIVLDTNWMFDAIYAVLNREDCKRNIERRGGQFSPADLGYWLWDGEGHSHEEQAQFMEMMRSAGMCFPISPNYYRKDDRDIEYIAPDLLPAKQPSLAGRWVAERETKEFSIAFDILPQALFRAVMSRIGSDAKLNGVYWKTGFYIFEQKFSSHAIISLESGDEFSGEVAVKTQGPQAEGLCSNLVELVYKVSEEFGFASTTPRPDPKEKRVPAETGIKDEEGKDSIEADEHQYGQATPSNYSEELFVSYAWANDAHPQHEENVDRLGDEAEARGIKIWRDKTDLKTGESIEKFMSDLAQSRQIYVFLSKKYLESESCIYELYNIWRRSEADSNIFQKRTKIYNIDADIRTKDGRRAFATFWKDKYETYKASDIKNFDTSGESSIKRTKLTQKVSIEIEDILSHIADKVQPNTFDEFLEKGFEGLE